MRVAVSDYDGTMTRGGKVSEETMKAVRQWRAAGNVFGVATGRDLSMIRHEIERWDIPFDFLICCNGAAIYSASGEILACEAIDDHLVPKVLDHPAGRASLHYEICSDGATFFYMRSPKSWFPRLGTPYTEISLDEAFNMRGLQQISLAYDNEEEGLSHATALGNDFAHSLSSVYNRVCLDITAAGVSKASAILELLRLKGWPEEGLLAIGDGENDLPMIRRFGGHTVEGAAKAVLAEADIVYTSVGDMLINFMGK